MFERRHLSESEVLGSEIQWINGQDFERIKQNGSGIVSLILSEANKRIGTEIKLAKNKIIDPLDNDKDEDILIVVITKVLEKNRFEVTQTSNV